MTIITSTHNSQDAIAAVVGDTVILREWMSSAETSLYSLVSFLDDLHQRRSPPIIERILQGLDKFLTQCQFGARSRDFAQMVTIVSALLSAFCSSADPGAEHWWNRVFEALHRLDPGPDGRAAWYRTILIRHTETRHMSKLCSQYDNGIVPQT